MIKIIKKSALLVVLAGLFFGATIKPAAADEAISVNYKIQLEQAADKLLIKEFTKILREAQDDSGGSLLRKEDAVELFDKFIKKKHKMPYFAALFDHAITKCGLLYIDEPCIDGYPLLHVAAKYGWVQGVEFLLRKGANVYIYSLNGETALIVASRQGHIDVVRCLIKNKAAVRQVDQDGRNAYIIARDNGHMEVEQLLLKILLKIHVVGIGSQTPLMAAAYKGDLFEVQRLIDQRVDVNAVDYNGEGYTALMMALREGHINIAQLLLDAGANVDVAGYDGITSLMRASFRGNIAVVKWLIQKRVNVNRAEQYGQTALMLALGEGHMDVAQLLLNAGANPNISVNGVTPLMLAAKNKSQHFIKMIVKRLKQIGLENINSADRALIKKFVLEEVVEKFVLEEEKERRLRESVLCASANQTLHQEQARQAEPLAEVSRQAGKHHAAFMGQMRVISNTLCATILIGGLAYLTYKYFYGNKF